MKHPIAMIIVVTTFIVICLLPLRTANLQFPDVEALPKQSDTKLHMRSTKRHLIKLQNTC